MIPKIDGLIIMLLIMASTACQASPLTDYSLGKVSFDVNLGDPTLTSNNESTSMQSNTGYGVTAGIRFGYAGQYIVNNFKLRTPVNGIGEIRAQQFNILANKLNRLGNISAVIGVSNTEIIGDASKKGIVAGLVGTVSIAPKTHVYATVRTGSYLESYEVGIGYNFSHNNELTLDYRNANYKNLSSDDITIKGPYAGIVYIF